MKPDNNIPTYSLNAFGGSLGDAKPFSVEEFNANRHFEVQYPHRHDFFEVLFLTQGSGIHIIDDHRYDITPPCLFFLSPGQAHRLELSKDIGGYIFLFSADFYLLDKSDKNRLLELPFFFNAQQRNPPLVLQNETDKEFLSNLFARGVENMSAGHDDYGIIGSILDLVLNTCHQLYPAELSKGKKSKGQILVKKFRMLIEENYRKNPTVQQYADWLNITPNHLTQTVKSVTGKTSLDLIKEKSILEIKRLLIHTDLSVTEIADMNNFSDQSYLTKVFKRHAGMTPSEYRDRH
ncbi:AraC family transcriptional regulator (plasmid) [Fulvitalea axinellae]|uniref:AraC family transcriptional regulator n=1 Tax=Fulvitalea axinellae TaxID=1182444 RepID=A0AAU9DB24_9BACT|nr:AraC family transcriptional regulator [Fulvitalea axinellae]